MAQYIARRLREYIQRLESQFPAFEDRLRAMRIRRRLTIERNIEDQERAQRSSDRPPATLAGDIQRRDAADFLNDRGLYCLFF